MTVRPLAVIIGCESFDFSDSEVEFFTKYNPFGLILFERNCRDQKQISALTHRFRSLVNRRDAPVLIDQEGGRVARLRPPNWRSMPPAMVFGQLFGKNIKVAEGAIKLNYRLIAEDLRLCGININCAPVLDLPIPGADDVIGDRALGSDAAQVVLLGLASCDGLASGGVLPIIKHIPGHGRALSDSHKFLPVVSASLKELQQTDFKVFKNLGHQPIAMTAHVIFSSIDDVYPATVSSKVIKGIVREYINFTGLLISDDISDNMVALRGGVAERAEAALSAGCDVVLHCNGNIKDIPDLISGAREMSDISLDRWSRALKTLNPVTPINTELLADELNSLIEGFENIN